VGWAWAVIRFRRLTLRPAPGTAWRAVPSRGARPGNFPAFPGKICGILTGMSLLADMTQLARQAGRRRAPGAIDDGAEKRLSPPDGGSAGSPAALAALQAANEQDMAAGAAGGLPPPCWTG